MWTILVPIDLTEQSQSIAVYALELASDIIAKIEFCLVVEIPETIPMAGFMLWPSEDFSSSRDDAQQDMRKFMEEMYHYAASIGRGHVPMDSLVELGTINDILLNRTKVHHRPLLLIDFPPRMSSERYFKVSMAMHFFENTKVPVLMVPQSAPYRKVKKVALATNLSTTDIETVHGLTMLFMANEPEILLVHVIDQNCAIGGLKKTTSDFLDMIGNRIDYRRIYYRQINGKNVHSGLEWLEINGHADVIAIVHGTGDVIPDPMDGSYTRKLAMTTSMPLLILPRD